MQMGRRSDPGSTAYTAAQPQRPCWSMYQYPLYFLSNCYAFRVLDLYTRDTENDTEDDEGDDGESQLHEGNKYSINA